MRTIRLQTALACAFLVALSGSALAAQGTSRPQPRPEALPPVEAPAVRTPTQQRPPTGQAGQEQIERDAADEPRRFTFRRSIFRLAQDYTLPAGEHLRELTIVFGDAALAGQVDQNVVVVMGSARLAATARIDGSLVVVGGSARIEEGAAVRQDLVVVGGTAVAPAGYSPLYGEHVVVGTEWLGDTLDGIVPWVTQGLLWGRLIVPGLEWIWVVVGIFFLVYLALNAVFDRPVAASADVLVEKPVSTFFVGLLVLLLSVPVIVILAASVIGLAIVPFLVCALIVVGLVGKVGVARAIGRTIVRPELPERRAAGLAAFVLGFALLTLAYMVPVLGFVTWALASVLGLGAAAVTFRALMRRERPAGVRPAAPATVTPPAAAAAPDAPPVAPVQDDTPLPPIPPPPADVPPRLSAFAQGLAQYPRAAFLDRAAAFALDCVLVAIANGILDWNRNDGSYMLLLLVYHVAFWAWKGTTLGGIIVGIKVVRTDGRELTFADALVRGLSGILSLAALGIGAFWMLQDPERQTWHDKIAGTLVVKAPREVVLPT